MVEVIAMTSVALPAAYFSEQESATLRSKLKFSINSLGLCATLAIMQVLDGILTAIGVSAFGHNMEGNPLLRGLMTTIGEMETLFLVKLLTICAIIFLYKLSHEMKWINTAIIGLIGFYLCAAIIPWTYILVSQI